MVVTFPMGDPHERQIRAICWSAVASVVENFHQLITQRVRSPKNSHLEFEAAVILYTLFSE